MKRGIAFVVILTFSFASIGAAKEQQAARPFTIDDLLKIRRVSDPQLSPDGRWIAYTIADTDLAANRRTTQIYLVSTDGGEPRQLTTEKQSSYSPRWSPDGKWIAFTTEVYPECSSDDCNKQRAEKAAASKVKAKIADRLLYRHWNSWKEGRRTHVFAVSTESGQSRDFTPGDHDAPPFSLGGPTDYAFSPDSKELAFARNTDKDEATSTNSDVWVVSIKGGAARNI